MTEFKPGGKFWVGVCVCGMFTLACTVNISVMMIIGSPGSLPYLMFHSFVFGNVFSLFTAMAFYSGTRKKKIELSAKQLVFHVVAVLFLSSTLTKMLGLIDYIMARVLAGSFIAFLLASSIETVEAEDSSEVLKKDTDR